MTIVYRSTKGSNLTPSEVDGNFADLAARTDLAWAMVSVEPSVRSGSPNAPELEPWHGGISASAYYPDQTMECFATFDVPYDWVAGTGFRFGIHFTVGNTTLTGNVRLSREFTVASPGGVFPTPTVGGGSSVAIDGTPYKMYQLFSPSAYPGTGLSPNTAIVNRFFRDGENALDTFEEKIYILGIDFYYQRNKFGQPNYQAPYI